MISEQVGGGRTFTEMGASKLGMGTKQETRAEKGEPEKLNVKVSSDAKILCP